MKNCKIKNQILNLMALSAANGVGVLSSEEIYVLMKNLEHDDLTNEQKKQIADFVLVDYIDDTTHGDMNAEDLIDWLIYN